MLDTNPITTLRVAVSGHRDLDPSRLTELRGEVQAAIKLLSEKCGSARVELMTGMADGADRLVADVASGLGCLLHIVLPRAYEEYLLELSAEGQQRLEELSSRPDARLSIIEKMPTPDRSHESEDAAPYDRLGVYLAKSAHVLLALWDGQPVRKAGGTLDVLTRFLDRAYDPAPQTELPRPIEEGGTQDLPGPTAVWIRAARVASGDRGAPVTSYLVGSGLAGVWRRNQEPPAPLKRMLDDLSDTSHIATEATGPSAGYPLLDEIPKDIDPGVRAALKEIQDGYLEADRLALMHQAKSDWSFIGASLVAAAMGFAFLWFAKIGDHVFWLYAYLVLFAVGYVIFRTARSRHWLRHHLSLRVLAETLRVRFFTVLLGISDLVDSRRILAVTGIASFPGFAWTTEAERIGVPTTQGLSPEPASSNELVQRQWVDDQAGYFARKIEQLHGRHERLELVQRILYVLSFLTVVVIIVFGSDLKAIYGPGHVSIKTILIFLMGLLPLWLTLWELHQGRMATQELLWQFRNQATIFRRASTQLRALDDGDSEQRIFVELAERSLFETYLWTIHRFHREFTPPAGG